jgi:hypothetical protein
MVSTAIKIALSTSACIAFVICNLDDFPTMQTISVPESISALTWGSSSTFAFNFLVEPKLTNFAFLRLSSFLALLKNSSSFGDAPGQPPSIKVTPKSSSNLAIASLSFTEGDIPSC